MEIRSVLVPAGCVATGLVVAAALRPESSARPLVIDPGVRSAAVDTATHLGEPVPPDFTPGWTPQAAETVTLAPGQDFGFVGFTRTAWNPPDPDLAVGPDHIVVAVNMDIRFYTKDGTLTHSQPLTGPDGFWGPVGAETFVFDPVSYFDTLSGRFVVLCTERVGSGDYLDLAVSDDADPNGDWNLYRWNTDDICGGIDFPNIGVGPEAIYVTTDCFNAPGGNKIWIVDKTAAINGDPTFPQWLQTSDGFLSLGAVKSYDADQPAQYFATASRGSTTSIRIHAVRDPRGTPIRDVFELPVPAYTDPPGAQQLGSSNRVSTVDRRIKNGVYRNGSLWLSHTVGDDGVARTRWYEVRMNGWPTGGTPALAQVQTVDLGRGVHNWFSDVDVDDAGNMAIAFNRSSSSEFVSIQRSFRLAGDPPSTIREPVTMQTSTSAETSSRWGDYGGIHQDPAAPGTFWQHHEYRTTDWRTWVGRFRVSSSCPEDLDDSGAVDFGDVLEILSAWGPCPKDCPEDLDASGAVDFGDILAVLSAWGAC